MGRRRALLPKVAVVVALGVAGFLASTALADPPPPNGNNTSPFAAMTSWTNLIGCVRLDGNRDKDRGSIRFVEVTSPQGRAGDGDFFWNMKTTTNVNDSPFACQKNEQEI